MDLTRLYNLTTPELREEAERLGVTDTYAMSRGQLIQAIRTKAAPRQQEGFLGKVFGFAKWALQAAGESSSGTPAPASEPESVPVPVPEPEPEPEPSRKEDASHPPRDFGASDSSGASEPTREEDVSDPPRDLGASDGPGASESLSGATEAEVAASSRPPAGVFSESSGLFEEPFPTLTMARILAEQGHFKRALAIYTRLVDEEPGDGDLVAEADAVRAQARARRSHAPQ